MSTGGLRLHRDRRLVALAGVLVGVSWCAPVFAENAPIYLGGTCLPEGVDYQELSKVLRAELSPRPVAPLDALSGALDAVEVLALDDCVETPASVRISVWRGAERRERQVSLTDLPREDRSRGLALLLAETHIDPAVSRPAPAEPVPWVVRPPSIVPPTPLPPRAPIPSLPPRQASWKIRASVAFRYATETNTPSGGAFAGVAWPRFGGGASLFLARRTVTEGQINLWVPAATAYYDLIAFSEALALRGALDLGAAVATGDARSPARSTTQASFHGALRAGLVGTLHLNREDDLEAAVDVGYATSLRAQANGADVVSLDGVLLTAEVGLRFY